ncbi:DUF3006 family protein [Halegenticoccus soli]|uniref:DUF3006 family protein n=1 Tax=Halegenticoccus soli TaxID=1985678 RepID=UPI0022B92C4F|nr:DUF3006 family protein [Halegenticoccus soli]
MSTATVDRLEEGDAVVLVEVDDEIANEILLDEEQLPADTEESDVLEVVIADGKEVDLESGPETTAQCEQAIRERCDRLFRRPDDSQE